ncbi:FixH family protein [Motiliproteus sediminis]|uniref:FixH family protein n=1 Tax=Motiliproteus sediminis TaxID=1468178 RepID=UPI001AEFADD3|nr:FixH family protein [Motiliproteus sediminis]
MSKSTALLKNPTLLVWGGLLAAFFVANGVFIYLAQQSNPGLVVDNYYERGQDYEKNMLKRMASQPDWQLSIDRPEKLQRGVEAMFELTALSGSGEVLNPDLVTVFGYRPTDAKFDFSTPMVELQSGIFRGAVVFPMAGNWDLLVTVEKDGVEHSVAERVRVAD